MRRLVVLYQSNLGKKVIVAATGVVMIGFLLGHMSGNLKIFLPDVDGVPDIDIYGAFLRHIGEPMLPYAGFLWASRIVLLFSLILHVVCVLQLAVDNQNARPVDYDRQVFARATPSARWMMYTGMYLLAFIVLHLLHLTVGVIDPGNFEHGMVYQNLQLAFDSIPWVAFYVISMLVVALHLYHGVWSLFQTVGWDNPDRNKGLRQLAVAIAVVLLIGFVAIPLSFFFGLVKHVDPSKSKHPETAIVVSGIDSPDQGFSQRI